MVVLDDGIKGVSLNQRRQLGTMAKLGRIECYSRKYLWHIGLR